jgi:hypothetical protein
MENKLTAVEWLVEKLTPSIALQQKYIDELCKQAKEMEKEQHGETWDAALIDVDKRGGILLRALVDFDEYWEKYQMV